MIDFSCTNENFRNDLMELIRAFEQRTDETLSLCVGYVVRERELKVELRSDKFDNFVKFRTFPFAPAGDMEAKRLTKRYLKIAIYDTLVFLTGAHDVFKKDFFVRQEKLELIERIVDAQRGKRNPDPERVADLFVFIPFCPTRCAYCSFVSMPVDRQRKLLRPYTDCLLQEISYLKKTAKKLGYTFRAVYIGGGTPTALPLDMLDEVLSAAAVRGVKEFTVEAGRPDTITPEALGLLKKRGVKRISVNPQTFNDATLERIGRRHTSADVERAYALAKKAGFDVNMDLIAMLPGESAEDFFRSVDRAAELAPANVTVHTLYLKKGSALRVEGYKNTENATAERMVFPARRVCITWTSWRKTPRCSPQAPPR